MTARGNAQKDGRNLEARTDAILYASLHCKYNSTRWQGTSRLYNATGCRRSRRRGYGQHGDCRGTVAHACGIGNVAYRKGISTRCQRSKSGRCLESRANPVLYARLCGNRDGARWQGASGLYDAAQSRRGRKARYWIYRDTRPRGDTGNVGASTHPKGVTAR